MGATAAVPDPDKPATLQKALERKREDGKVSEAREPAPGNLVELVYRVMEPTPSVGAPPRPKLPIPDRNAPALYWHSAGERIPVPFRELDDLLDALRFEYALGGGQAVDALVQQVDAALIDTLGLKFSDVLERLHPPAGGMPRFTEDGIVFPRSFLLRVSSSRSSFPDGPYVALAETDPLPPMDCARLLIAAEESLSFALAALKAELARDLAVLEEVAIGLLRVTLESAHAEILREGLRYFDFFDNESLDAELDREGHHMAMAQEGARAKNADAVRKMPLAAAPTHLRKALVDLKPLAEDVINKQGELTIKERNDSLASTYGMTSLVDSMARAEMKAAVDAAAQKLAIELGKMRESHPVILRLEPEEIVKGAGAGRDVLGEILFPALVRASAANKAVRRELSGWDSAFPLQSLDEWPGEALLVKAKKLLNSQTIWRHRKYMERAILRAFPAQIGPAYAAAIRIVKALHGGDWSGVEMASMVTRDLALFHAAGKADKAIEKKVIEAAALGRKSFFATKFLRCVPVLNWVYAGYNVINAVHEHRENSNLYYCTLDPADALIELKPSLHSLTGEVVTEVAFAFI